MEPDKVDLAKAFADLEEKCDSDVKVVYFKDKVYRKMPDGSVQVESLRPKATIGIDIDGTITDMPVFFSFLTNALIAQGHEVHLITYRMAQFKEYTEEQMKEMDVAFTKVHCCDKMLPAPEWKAQVAEELKIDMLFEDSLDNLKAMPPGVVRVWVGQRLQDMQPGDEP